MARGPTPVIGAQCRVAMFLSLTSSTSTTAVPRKISTVPPTMDPNSKSTVTWTPEVLWAKVRRLAPAVGTSEWPGVVRIAPRIATIRPHAAKCAARPPVAT